MLIAFAHTQYICFLWSIFFVFVIFIVIFWLLYSADYFVSWISPHSMWSLCNQQIKHRYKDNFGVTNQKRANNEFGLFQWCLKLGLLVTSTWKSKGWMHRSEKEKFKISECDKYGKIKTKFDIIKYSTQR